MSDSSDVPRTAEEYRLWWAEHTDVPYGYCWCGCGNQTSLSPRSRFVPNRPQIKDTPQRYMAHHSPTSPNRGRKEIVCSWCGNVFTVPVTRATERREYCGKSCAARDTPTGWDRWGYKGGHVNKSTGYRHIVLNGKVGLEHRLVMERHLGRDLRADEHVHHIDGDRLNNDLKNLMLVSPAEHKRIHRELLGD